MTMPLWLFCLMCFPALVGTLALLSATWKTVKAVRAARRRNHPLAMRRQPGGQPLLDEPPSQCPECATPYVAVRRSEFAPEGEKFKLPATEHFACENGHRWFGVNQKMVLGRRIAARRKLPAAPALEAPQQDDAQRLQAKVRELDAVAAEVDSKKH